MKGLEIVKLDLKRENEQGPIYEFENSNNSALILVKKKKGCVFAGKYHRGDYPSRFPKVIVFLDGSFEACFKNVDSGEELKKTYSKPVMFKVMPKVFHEFKALSDCTLLDMNPWGYYDDAENL
jgi:hypothetical protein